MKKIGLKVTVDPVGNIRERLECENSNAPIIMSGFYIYKVYKGGKFDGNLGLPVIATYN